MDTSIIKQTVAEKTKQTVAETTKQTRVPRVGSLRHINDMSDTKQILYVKLFYV